MSKDVKKDKPSSTPRRDPKKNETWCNFKDRQNLELAHEGKLPSDKPGYYEELEKRMRTKDSAMKAKSDRTPDSMPNITNRRLE